MNALDTLKQAIAAQMVAHLRATAGLVVYRTGKRWHVWLSDQSAAAGGRAAAFTVDGAVVDAWHDARRPSETPVPWDEVPTAVQQQVYRYLLNEG